MRVSAASALEWIGSAAAAAVPALAAALEDGLRSSAANALRKIGPAAAAAIPALVAALKDDHFHMRSSAACALGRIGPEAAAAVPGLVASLKDEDAGVRRSAAFALGSFGEAVMPSLVAALEDDEAWVRGSAADALARIGPKAVPALAAAFNRFGGELRPLAADALVRIGPEAVPALATALNSHAYELPRSAADALVRIGGAAVPALVAVAQVRQGLGTIRGGLCAGENRPGGRSGRPGSRRCHRGRRRRSATCGGRGPDENSPRRHPDTSSRKSSNGFYCPGDFSNESFIATPPVCGAGAAWKRRPLTTFPIRATRLLTRRRDAPPIGCGDGGGTTATRTPMLYADRLRLELSVGGEVAKSVSAAHDTGSIRRMFAWERKQAMRKRIRITVRPTGDRTNDLRVAANIRAIRGPIHPLRSTG